MYKIKHGLAPPVFNQFVNLAAYGYRLARSAVRGDYMVPLRKSVFSQRVLSVSGAREWSSIPSNITNLNTYASFKFHLKKWLIESLYCQHQFYKPNSIAFLFCLFH